MRWRIPLTLICGGLLPLAFSPFNVYSFAFFMPAFLLYFWLKSTPKQAALLGFLFALGFFGVGISWIYVSIHYFGNASKLLAGFLTLCVVMLMSLHFALYGYVFRKFFQNKTLMRQSLLVFPALWVLAEVTNTAIFGFPWLLLGYTQLTNPLSGLAPIIGVYGLSLIVTMIAGAVVLIFLDRRKMAQVISAATILLSIIIGWLFQDHAWTKPQGKPIQASLIQGNIPQNIKWDARYLIDNINVYKQLTMKHLSSQLIVWPEGAVPVVAENIPTFMRSLDKLAKENNTTIIFGAPSENKETKQFYNAIFMIGDSHGRYLKRHLVPFGEYTPFSSIIKPLADHFHLVLSDLSVGPKSQQPLQFNGVLIAPFICYEIIFPQDVLDTAEHTQLLLTVSDDSWFGKSIALAQHLQMAQMRSLETGRYMLMATNTGITAVISPFGKILKGAAIDRREVITHDVEPMRGKTPLMVWYYYPIFTLIAIMLAFSILL